MSSMPPPPPPPGSGASDLPPTFAPPPSPGPGYSPSAPNGYGTYQSQGPTDCAGFWARLGARLLDALLLLLINVVFAVIGIVLLRRAFRDCYTAVNSRGNDQLHCPDGAVHGGALAAGIVVLAAGVILSVIVYCRWVGRGQTPGMKAVGIKVVDAMTGAPIGTGRAVGRYFASILSGAVCYLGYLWMLWDPRKQTWHDKIVGTVSVRA